MEKIKKYKSFLKEGNFIEDFIKDNLVDREKGSEKFKSESKNFDTNSFFSWMTEKINKGDINPIYVFNKVNRKEPFYVMSEFHEDSKSHGFEEDEIGDIVLNGKKYSYCIFNCSKIEEFSEEFLISDLNKILDKNNQWGKRTIIEVTNFSSLDEKEKSVFKDLVEKRTIGDYNLGEGEFFIFSDNSNSKKGGKNVSSQISSIFPLSKFYIIDHNFSDSEENLS